MNLSRPVGISDLRFFLTLAALQGQTKYNIDLCKWYSNSSPECSPP